MQNKINNFDTCQKFCKLHRIIWLNINLVSRKFLYWLRFLDLPVEILNPNQETKKIGEIKES